jgi:hypothetical protein
MQTQTLANIVARVVQAFNKDFVGTIKPFPAMAGEDSYAAFMSAQSHMDIGGDIRIQAFLDNEGGAIMIVTMSHNNGCPNTTMDYCLLPSESEEASDRLVQVLERCYTRAALKYRSDKKIILDRLNDLRSKKTAAIA